MGERIITILAVERETGLRPLTRAEAFAAQVRSGTIEQTEVPRRGADRVVDWCRLADGSRVVLYEEFGRLLERRKETLRRSPDPTSAP